MPEDWFGDDVAARYDDDESDWFAAPAVEPAVALLAELAGDGPALELGIGTGRIALPLAARGVAVHGIDLSAAMVQRLRAKPGGADIPVALGDFATTTVDETFSVAYLVFNTIKNLTTQDAQVACFANVTAHLRPGGRFVVEDSVPQLQRLPRGETVVPFMVTPTRVGFDEYDVVDQRMWSHHWWDDGGVLRTVSTPFRYVWPAELDLMARLAGMTLEHRWGGWEREPFTATSDRHVSVWRRDG